MEKERTVSLSLPFETWKKFVKAYGNIDCHLKEKEVEKYTDCEIAKQLIGIILTGLKANGDYEKITKKWDNPFTVTEIKPVFLVFSNLMWKRIFNLKHYYFYAFLKEKHENSQEFFKCLNDSPISFLKIVIELEDLFQKSFKKTMILTADASIDDWQELFEYITYKQFYSLQYTINYLNYLNVLGGLCKEIFDFKMRLVSKDSTQKRLDEILKGDMTISLELSGEDWKSIFDCYEDSKNKLKPGIKRILESFYLNYEKALFLLGD